VPSSHLSSATVHRTWRKTDSTIQQSIEQSERPLQHASAAVRSTLRTPTIQPLAQAQRRFAPRALWFTPGSAAAAGSMPCGKGLLRVC
jgi:hypothetical protein